MRASRRGVRGEERVGDDRLPDRAEPPSAGAGRLCDPAGAGNPDLRTDAGTAHRFLPRQRLAFSATAAASGFGGAFRVGIPSSSLSPDQKSPDGPSGPEQDFTDLHAWTEVHLSGAGWIGLDPTSGLLAGEGHDPACMFARRSQRRAGHRRGRTRDASSFEHQMSVMRIAEKPRTTKPYWQRRCAMGRAIEVLGRAVDRELAAGDGGAFD